MIALHPQSCRSCRRPWCATPKAVAQHGVCPFCGAASIQTGSPSPVCRGCGETLRRETLEAPPDELCYWCFEEEEAA